MENSKWTDEEMGSNASAEGAKKLPIKDAHPTTLAVYRCLMTFHCFIPFANRNSTDGKNILFIPGGPGPSRYWIKVL